MKKGIKDKIDRYLVKIQLSKILSEQFWLNRSERPINRTYLSLLKKFREIQREGLRFDESDNVFIGFNESEKTKEFFFIDGFINEKRNGSLHESERLASINELLSNKKKKVKFDDLIVYAVYFKNDNSEIKYLIDS